MIARRLGWATVIAGWLAMLVTPAIGALAGHPIAAARSVPQVAAYLLTGTVVFAKQPRNPVTRRLLAFGVLLAAGYAIGSAYSAYLVKDGTPGWAWLVILAMQGIDVATFIVIFAACAMFPDGKYQRAYERRMVAVLAAAVPVLLAAQLLGSARLTQTDFVWQNSVSAANPAALPALAGLGAMSAVLIQAGGVALLLGVVVLILRYRRFGPAERQQIAWPLYALALTGCAILVLGAASSADRRLPDWLQYLLYVPVLLLIPAGLVIGIVRYRLLDIDLVVRRSVVYGALWLLIAAGYAGLAVAFGVAAGRRVPLNLAIVLTIVVTMAAVPIRRRLERLADRLVFGRRLSGYELISQLGARLEASPEPEDVADTVASAVRAGLGASWVRVSLGRPHERRVATAGIDLAAPDDPVLHVPLVHGPDVVGAIDCGTKTEGRYTPADQQLLATLGRQAALAIRNSQLTAELSHRFDELAASRARLVHAEAAGRRRLERDIHDGAQQELVAVLARLGLARNQLRRDKDLAEATLRECLTDGRRALESLQELVRGIHPPVLTDRGLLDAVRERAARMPIATEVSSHGLTPDARFGPDIEAAAYFFASEALSNVLKHAGATRAWVCLQSASGRLTVEVRDDGKGFEVATAARSGLRGLRDRIEALGGRMDVASTTGHGTSVSAWLPAEDQLMSDRLRIVIAEDNYLVREGTRRLLEDSGEIDVLAGVGNGDELLTAVRQLRPDAVLTDIRMPPGHQVEGIDAAHAIRQHYPQIGVVVLSQYSDATYAVQLFRDGTDGLGYLLKASIGDLGDLLHALREVTCGRSVVDARVVELLVEQRIRQAESPLNRLAPRELEVLKEMAEGKTNAAIGESLHLSESAIEKYVNVIFTKLGLSEERKISRRVVAVLAYLRDLDRRG